MSSKPKTTKNNPAPVPQGQVVAEFSQYEEASGYVENLVKNNFPPNMILIVGSELKSVERVRGKLSYARVAMSGATTGAWMGLLVGLIIGSGATATDASSAAMGSMTSSLVIGAGIGMLINVIRFSLAKRKRGFISQSSMVAAKYQVQVPVGLTNHPAFNVGDSSGQADA